MQYKYITDITISFRVDKKINSNQEARETEEILLMRQ